MVDHLQAREPAQHGDGLIAPGQMAEDQLFDHQAVRNDAAGGKEAYHLRIGAPKVVRPYGGVDQDHPAGRSRGAAR